ncbi:MAG: hypothetical protein ACREET_12450, partial [Stellaceae bacterium]
MRVSSLIRRGEARRGATRRWREPHEAAIFARSQGGRSMSYKDLLVVLDRAADVPERIAVAAA